MENIIKKKCPCCGKIIKNTYRNSYNYEKHMKKHPLYNPNQKFEKTKPSPSICPDCGGKKSIQGKRCSACNALSMRIPEKKRYCKCGNQISRQNATGRCRECYFEQRFGR